MLNHSSLNPSVWSTMLYPSTTAAAAAAANARMVQGVSAYPMFMGASQMVPNALQAQLAAAAHARASAQIRAYHAAQLQQVAAAAAAMSPSHGVSYIDPGVLRAAAAPHPQALNTVHACAPASKLAARDPLDVNSASATCGANLRHLSSVVDSLAGDALVDSTHPHSSSFQRRGAHSRATGRAPKVCCACNKSHDHVHHLPIMGAVRALRASDRSEIRVEICGGCYKWAKRHFAGGHRRCDGGTMRRNCRQRLDVAHANDLLLVGWDAVQSNNGTGPSSKSSSKATGAAGRKQAKTTARASASTADKPVPAPAPRVSGKKRRRRAAGGTSLAPRVSTVRDVVEAESFVTSTTMISPANALLPDADDAVGTMTRTPKRRRTASPAHSSVVTSGKQSKPQTSGLLGVLAAVACDSE